MSRKSKRRKYVSGIERRTSPGAPPGSLVVDPQAPLPIIRVIAYGSEAVHEELVEDVSRIGSYLGRQPVTWVNVDGLGDAAVIRKLGEIFGIHRLALEDIINSHQRAKVDQYDNHLFVVGRMVEMADHVETEQLSLFLGKSYVLTFQERVGDAFDPVRERIRKAGGRVRNAGPDYLAYALIDAFIDNYFPVLEKYGERLESIEEDVLSRPEPVLVSRMHEVKRDLLTLRRAIWPLRETVNSLVREPSPFISDETRVYFRDCYDHTIQIIDLLENYRDVASGLMEVYLSSASNRLNEIMKILTMFTAFFIPLSLIAGIYGMNFNTARSPFNMPELNWYLGYPFVLGLMATVALGMVTFFRRKGWLRSRLGSREPETRD
ncbi:MAG: corA [Acidobacteria bacterium]|nr:corA [Acidobacteriota bacterium]